MRKLSIFFASVLLAISACRATPSASEENSNEVEPQPEPQRKSYAGYRVYTITLKSKEEAEHFEKFKSTLYFVDTWKEPTPNTSRQRLNGRAPTDYKTSVMVPADLTAILEEYFQSQKFPFTVMIEDVEALIQEEARENAARISPTDLTWDAYYSYDKIIEWFDEIVDNNSDIATASIIGNSTEGRALKMVKLSKPGSAPDKNAILIDGTFHAREWISPAIVTYILNEILTKRDEHSAVLDAVDLYIVPFVNPDGYAYTKTDRMWRKTRSRSASSSCYGVDPNRNFDFHFGGPGTSNSPCSEIYHGPTAFSEPEAAALRDVLLDKSINFVSYLTIHSYGQWWLTPWSWTYDLPKDYDDLMKFANLGSEALTAVHGTDFLAGATTEILGTTAGCSDDWSKAVAEIKYANTIEVRDTGRYGFVLPPSLIRVTAEETWAGIRAVTQFDFDNGNQSRVY